MHMRENCTSMFLWMRLSITFLNTKISSFNTLYLFIFLFKLCSQKVVVVDYFCYLASVNAYVCNRRRKSQLLFYKWHNGINWFCNVATFVLIDWIAVKLFDAICQLYCLQCTWRHVYKHQLTSGFNRLQN